MNMVVNKFLWGAIACADGITGAAALMLFIKFAPTHAERCLGVKYGGLVSAEFRKLGLLGFPEALASQDLIGFVRSADGGVDAPAGLRVPHKRGAGAWP